MFYTLTVLFEGTIKYKNKGGINKKIAHLA
jgi:hypothetical protein